MCIIVIIIIIVISIIDSIIVVVVAAIFDSGIIAHLSTSHLAVLSFSGPFKSSTRVPGSSR